MNKERLVIYHAECADGFAAAWVLWKKFGDEAGYYPASYQEPPPNVSGKEVYIVDFSYPRETYEQILGDADSVTLIDHHATAFDEIKGLQGVHLDDSQSGCVLTFKHFFPGKDVPAAMRFIEDYDLWSHQFSATKPFMVYVDTLEHDFFVWDLLMQKVEKDLFPLADEGKVMQRHADAQIDKLVRTCARKVTFKGVEGWTMNVPRAFASVAGSVLAKKSGTFAIVWHVNSKGVAVCSVRSVGECSARKIAERFGGGGHDHAASFKLRSVGYFGRVFHPTNVLSALWGRLFPGIVK